MSRRESVRKLGKETGGWQSDLRMLNAFLQSLERKISFKMRVKVIE
jgi:hypothetical protein